MKLDQEGLCGCKQDETMRREVFYREEVVLDAWVCDGWDSDEVITLRPDLYSAVVCAG